LACLVSARQCSLVDRKKVEQELHSVDMLSELDVFVVAWVFVPVSLGQIDIAIVAARNFVEMELLIGNNPIQVG
jgi:hypothetical protein